MGTLKSKLRGKLMSSHGDRKNTRNALWVTYSPKLKADLTLASNNECVYWLVGLEVDSSLHSFQFGYEAQIKSESDQDFKKVDAIRTESLNREVQVHVLSAGNGGVVESTVLLRDKFPGKAVVEERKVTLVRVYSDYLRQQARSATRILRMIGFATQLRDHKYDLTAAKVELALKNLKSGRVEDILLASTRHDPMVVLGVLAEKILEGGVEVDLAECPFGVHSRWSLT